MHYILFVYIIVDLKELPCKLTVILCTFVIYTFKSILYWDHHLKPANKSMMILVLSELHQLISNPNHHYRDVAPAG